MHNFYTFRKVLSNHTKSIAKKDNTKCGKLFQSILQNKGLSEGIKTQNREKICANAKTKHCEESV
jgi:hypothetical protein